MLSKSRIRPGRVARLANALATLAVAAVATVVSSDLHAADIFKGQQIYQANCAICHGQAGRPVMPGAPNFANKERLLQSDFTLLTSIRSGKNAMPAFRGMLPDRDIMDVIAYIRTFN